MPSVPSSSRVPFALQEAIVRACGTVFYYKRPLIELMVRSGTPRALVDGYADLAKFVMVRHVLTELDKRGEAGAAVQFQLARELATMRSVVDPDNQEAGLKALAELRAVAREAGVLEGLRPTKRRSKEELAQNRDKRF